MTMDEPTDRLFVATGNDSTCSTAEPYAIALVELRASDLGFVSAWQVPLDTRVDDSDFGATPTLFTATIDGVTHTLVGVPNKNGVFYVFDEAKIDRGPVWQVPIAVGGISPENGDGSISSAAFDGTAVYAAGGKATVGGDMCKGTVRALKPADGSIMWQKCLHEGFVLGAVAAAPGVIAVGAGSSLILLAVADGQVLANLRDPDGGFNVFYGGAAIADGAVYIGNANGTLLAYAPA